MKWLIRPLEAWTDPVTPGPERRSSATFRSSWSETVVLLGDEYDKVGGKGPVVIELDIDASDLRQDGMLRAYTEPRTSKAVVSFTAAVGSLRFACDSYEAWSWKRGNLMGWQANVRAVALTLGALRSLERWGVARGAQQYTGFRAIPATTSGFSSAEAAAEWMRVYAAENLGIWFGDDAAPRKMYRHMARLMHPDNSKSPEARIEWDRLDAAWTLIQAEERRHQNRDA